MKLKHRERHKTGRIGWLRAAVLGANDGIVSTASLIIGVAAAGATSHSILIAGLAGLVAGAMSMAAGEYVSVYSQADTENAELEREKRELEVDDEGERMELAGIYVSRGLEPRLARQVADQLMAHDALAAHARDELGITEITTARPLQAAGFSAASFSIGAALPLLTSTLVQGLWLIPSVAVSSLVFLAVLGAIAARAGGASLVKGSIRVLFWGAMAMLATDIVGRIFGTAVS
jgi:VIT1/CCC1 family predicted Fe2+/Mn2+ transporter